MIPQELSYTEEHEWVRAPESDGGAVRIGITDYAQDALGDIVFVELPEVGASVTAGESIGELESTKSVSEVFAPVTGVIAARNEQLDGSPELVNSDPYGEGWLIEVTPEAGMPELLDAEAYAQLTDS